MPALSRRRAAAVAGISLGLLGLFAVSVWLAQTGGLAGADARVEAVVRARGSRAADLVASLIAATASLSAGALWSAALAVVAWAQPRLRPAVLALLAALLVEQLVELLLKSAVDHPGPPGLGRSVLGLGATGPTTAGSFPSGHMIRAIVLGAGTMLIAGRRAGLVVAAVYIAAVAATRVYLSEHWVSDVVGGALLGAAALPPIAALSGSRRGVR